MASQDYIFPDHHFLFQCAKRSCLGRSIPLNQYFHSLCYLVDLTKTIGVQREYSGHFKLCLDRKRVELPQSSMVHCVGHHWDHLQRQLQRSTELVSLAEREVYTEFWMSLIRSRDLPCTKKMTWLLRQSVMLSCTTGCSAATHCESCANPGL